MKKIFGKTFSTVLGIYTDISPLYLIKVLRLKDKIHSNM